MLRELTVRMSVVMLALAIWGAVDSPRPADARDASEVGIVSHVKALSDKVEDVSNPEAWRKSYITDGMSDQEKLLAIWRTVVKYRHQTDPSNEYIQDHSRLCLRHVLLRLKSRGDVGSLSRHGSLAAAFGPLKSPTSGTAEDLRSGERSYPEKALGW